MAEWLANPWITSLLIVAVLVGNICAVKYTVNMKMKLPSSHDKNKIVGDTEITKDDID